MKLNESNISNEYLNDGENTMAGERKANMANEWSWRNGWLAQ